jgi:hypothetical protein
MIVELEQAGDSRAESPYDTRLGQRPGARRMPGWSAVSPFHGPPGRSRGAVAKSD